MYWIDHTENQHRTLQLATKYDGKEYILHDFSDYVEVERDVYVVFQVDSLPTPSGDGYVSFHFYETQYYYHLSIAPYAEDEFRFKFSKFHNDDEIRSYLKNTIMPKLDFKHVHFQGRGIYGTDFDEIVSIE